MKRITGKIAFLTALLFLIPALLGCSVKKSDASRLPRPPREINLDPGESTGEPLRHPLVIITKRMQVNGCLVSYPFVCDDNTTILNRSIESAFTEFAAYCESPGCTVSYTVEFNRYGLLSLLLSCVTGDGRTVLTDAANFDADSGLRVYLSDCFGEGSDYAEKLRDIVLKTVENRGYTLLASEPAIGDGTLFLFTFGGIYVMFREYELCTYEAGEPRIKITLGALASCTSQDGLLNRLK
ncbi:MAG: DUF3298 domain-containing protein [Clostridia bacterium]|nr:DUF3298 domain-containing protein [Clostridia bacterium]